MTKRFSMVAVIAFGLIGCGGGEAASEAESVAPFTGINFSVHVPGETGLSPILEPLIEEWNARTGANAVVAEYASPDALDFSPGDVVIVSMSGSNAIASQMAVVPESSRGLEELNWNQLLRGLRERVAKRDREGRMLPLSCPTLLCYYRKDLLEASGQEPPKTWAEYNKLVTTVDEWAPGLTAVEPWGAETRSMMFTARSIAYASPRGSLSLFFDLDTGAPRLNTEGFTRALTEFKSVAPAFADCWDMTPDQCRTALLSGKAAIGLATEPSVAGAAVERAEDVQLGFCRLPGSPEVYSLSLSEWQSDRMNQPGLVGFDGYLAGVADVSDATALSAGFNLLRAVNEQVVGSHSSTVRVFTANWHADIAAPLFEPGLTIDEATNFVEASFETLRDEHLVVDLPVSKNAELQAALANVLTADAIANRPAADILGDINKAWQAIVDEVGSLEFANDYRRNIGVRQKK